MKVLDSLQRAPNVEIFQFLLLCPVHKNSVMDPSDTKYLFQNKCPSYLQSPLSLRKQPISLKKYEGKMVRRLSRDLQDEAISHRREWIKGRWGQALDVEVRLRNLLRASLTLPK